MSKREASTKFSNSVEHAKYYDPKCYKIPTSSNALCLTPMFNDENYHTWAIKMKFFLRSQGLWNVVIYEDNPLLLRENPTITLMKDKIQDEFEGCNKDRSIRLLTLKTKVKLMKINDNKSIKDYFGKIVDIVNQIQLLGEEFINKKVV
ncbi:hypothetical protein CR513_05198, partial [Mucuna pruriens]